MIWETLFLQGGYKMRGKNNQVMCKKLSTNFSRWCLLGFMENKRLLKIIQYLEFAFSIKMFDFMTNTLGYILSRNINQISSRVS